MTSHVFLKNTLKLSPHFFPSWQLFFYPETYRGWSKPLIYLLCSPFLLTYAVWGQNGNVKIMWRFSETFQAFAFQAALGFILVFIFCSEFYIQNLKGYTSSYIWMQLKYLSADIMSLWHKERTKLLTMAYYSLLRFLRQLVSLSAAEDKEKEVTLKHLCFFWWQYFHIQSRTGIRTLCQDMPPNPSGLRFCKSQRILKQIILHITS